MLVLDLIARFGAAALLLLVCTLLVRDAWSQTSARMGVLLSLGVVSSLIFQVPESLSLPHEFLIGLKLVVIHLNIFFWWFCRSLLDDQFQLSGIEWLWLALWSATGIPQVLEFVWGIDQGVMTANIIRSIGGVAMVAHVAYIALAERSNDLVETRRLVRGRFALAMGFCLLFIIATEWAGAFQEPSWQDLAEALFLFALSFWGALWLIRVDGDALLFESGTHASTLTGAMSQPEERFDARLSDLMEMQQLYLQPGLTIGVIADALDTPEHQVRKHINQVRGFRNFARFVNQYRLSHATERLAQVDQAAVPILTIALDSGFGSLATFNRAFKQELGETPSAFRARHMQPPSEQN